MNHYDSNETPITIDANRFASDISVTGTLKNMLCQGFDEKNGLCEEIDNSLDWGSLQIKITLNTTRNLYVHADNGVGMSEDKLADSHVLNKRSESSVSKFGRYGIGGVQSKVCITRLKSNTTTISKQIGDKSISQININWPKCCRNDQYRNIASPASSANENNYAKYVRDEFITEQGTVQMYECHPNAFKIISEGLSSTQIGTSWVYDLEVKYKEQLSAGVSIKVDIDGCVKSLIPIDPLRMVTTPEKYKRATHLELYINHAFDNIYVKCPTGG